MSRIAVIGLGVSGYAAAQAAAKRGDTVTVFDEKPLDSADRIERADRLVGEGIEVVAGWHGHFDDGAFDQLITSPGLRREHPILLDAQRKGIEIWGEIEYAYRISRAPIIAITGTNGKSTTTVLTQLLLKALGLEAVLCGNISGSGQAEKPLTEAAAESTPSQTLVAEVSSFQLEWVQEFRPKVATITNITPDHLDRHPSYEDYAQTKLRIFDAMGERDTVVLNASDAQLRDKILNRVASRPVRIVEFDATNSPVQDLATGNLSLAGEHNRINLAQAWALASALVLDANATSPRVRQALTEFRGLAHRMEIVGSKNGITIVNNSMCTNPAAVVASSRALELPHTLLMGGVDKDLDFAPVRAFLAETNRKVVLFGPNWSTFGAKIGREGPGFERLDDAFRYALDHAASGEAVMLAPGCASAYPYTNFRERGDDFRRIAQEWIRS